MTRPFASLSPQEALHAAIFIEERNAGIYQRFAEMFTEFRDADSMEIASVFWDMSVEEKRHSSVLQGRYTEQYGNSRCALTEEDLQEFIELPKLETGGVFGSPEDEQLPPRVRALQVAILAERGAQEFYANLVASTEEGPLRRLYFELATMEDGHLTYLQNILASSAAATDREIQ